MRTRYKDVGQALQGFFEHIAEGAKTCQYPQSSFPMGLFCLIASVVLSVLFRLMEARRNAR